MKSPSAINDDCDDIFGPPRTYATGYCPPKTRPSMISAKYRQKEERRKVLKISINKLKKIEDPEASLCRSVLINNTMKRLQKEARDEKIQKQQLNYPRCYDNDNFLNLKNEFIKNEMKSSSTFDEPRDFTSNDKKLMDSLNADFAIENDFDTKIAEEISALNTESAKNMEVLNGLVQENLNNLSGDTFTENNNTVTSESVEENGRFTSHKRSYDDMEDCDVQDVLSQFYMPPTPRLLTCIDDDEDVNVVDDEPLPKRAKTSDINNLVFIDAPSDVATPLDSSQQSSMIATATLNLTNCKNENVEITLNKVTDCKKKQDDFRINNFMNNNIPESESRLRYLGPGQNIETDSNSFSCGHASMFNEFQNNVFHSLIASLET